MASTPLKPSTDALRAEAVECDEVAERCIRMGMRHAARIARHRASLLRERASKAEREAPC